MEFRVTSGKREGRTERTGPGLQDPTVTLSLLPLHRFTVNLRTPIWIQASNQSLSRLLFVLCSCNFVKWRECHAHLPFVCPLLTVHFKTLSRTLAFKPAEMEILSKTLRIEDGKEPVGAFTALDTPAFEDRSPNSERRRTLLPSLDDSECCATPFGFSKNQCCSPHLHLLPTQPLLQLQHPAMLALRSRAGCRSSRLDPMDKREVPTETLESQLRQAQRRFTARRLGVYDGTACRHACPSGYPPPQTLRGLRPTQPLWATRAEGALLQSSSQTCRWLGHP